MPERPVFIFEPNEDKKKIAFFDAFKFHCILWISWAQINVRREIDETVFVFTEVN